jgi:hypothetical protein
MLIQGQVGPIASSTSLAAGVQATVRMDNLGGLSASQLLPRYYETTYRRQMYTIANQTGVTTSAALTTTYVGLCIANPTTSTVNVVVTKAGYAFPVAPAASAVVGLMTGVGATITTNLVTARNRFVGGVGAQCLASTSLTLPGTPVLETVLDIVTAATITTNPKGVGTIVDLEGSLILPPGAFCAFYTSTASGASGFFGSFQWVEVPL